MKQALFLSGAPGTGKTTIIRQAIAMVKERAGGFYTQEIRHQGIRQGFEIVTLDGSSAVLAYVNIRGPQRVGKYGVDTSNLDKVGVRALRQAIDNCEIIVVDEIGKMELFSPAFREAILEALDSGKRLLGTIMLQSHPWADQIKQDSRVKILQVSRANRPQIMEELLEWVREG